MAFQIPIQGRENTALRSPSQRDIVNPKSIDINVEAATKPLEAVSDALAKRASNLEKQAENLSELDFENKVNRDVQESKMKVLSTEGENSFVAADEAQKKLRYNLDQYLQKAPEKYRSKFSLIADKGLMDYDKASMGHQYRQQNIVFDKIEKENAAHLSDQAVLSVYNPEKFNALRDELDRRVELATRRKLGGDPDLGVPASPEVQEVINQHRLEAQSLLLRNTVESLVVGGDVGNAKKMRDLYASEITAKDMIDINKLIEKGDKVDETNAGFALMQDALDRFGGNENAAREYIREQSKGDGKVYQKAISLYNVEQSSKEAARIKQAKRSVARVMDQIRKNPLGFSPVMLKGVDPEFHDDVIRFAQAEASGENVVRDVPTYNRLQDAYLNNREHFIRMMEDTSAFYGRLPKQDIKEFESKLKEIQDPLAEKIPNSAFQKIANRIINEQAERRSNGQFTEDGQKRRAEIQTIFDEVARTVKARMGDRAAISDVENEIEKEMILRTQLPKEYGWWDKVSSFVTGEELPKEDTSNMTRQFKDYNPIHVEQVRKQLESTGQDASDRAVIKKLKLLRYLKHI